MSAADEQAERVRRRDDVLRRWGTRAWYAVGIAVFAAIAAAGIGAISGLVVPLVVAVVVGMLFVPVVDRLAERLPRPVAAGIVLVAVLAVAVGAVVVAVAGVVDQANEIGRQLSAGFDTIATWLDDLGVDADGDQSGLVGDLGGLLADVVTGIGGSIGTVFTSTAAFLAGTFVGVFLLYFILADWTPLAEWVAKHLGVAPEVGADIVDDATWSMREYFLALTIASLLVAAIVGVAMVVLGLPLALAVAAVTFITSYVPYLGAIFSGAFAALVALGAGGVEDALVILVVVLVAQNLVQAIVQTKLSGERLRLHPVVVFGSTIVGGATLGLLGAALSTPVVALAVRVGARLRQDAAPADAAGE